MIRSLIIIIIFSTVSSVAFAQADRPNILWIVSEDNNAAMIGCYGNSFATTPNIDRLATEGLRYKNAFSSAPVCAPSRCTLITGMYPPSMGTEHMRSTYPVPDYVKFFPKFLREAGYYTSNNSKKDYNTVDQPDAWDESSDKATYKNRRPGQPFFAVFNIFVSHESSIHKRQDSLRHDPDKVPLPPYHPSTDEIRKDWAQYYDKVETMDQQVGRLLEELEKEGLADNTIVFYYADNGGVLPRSKRFLFESGLHVPLVVRIPQKFQEASRYRAGTTTNQLVTFLDFAPTVLSLAGIAPPTYMQGTAFLGKYAGVEKPYAYSFRGRMDERMDLSRTVRDKKYRYVRNYLPHLPYGQYLHYLWLASSTRSWEHEFRAGRLNDTQSVFWKEKPSEELYDVDADPYNINNLATNPAYDSVMKRLRKANHDWLLKTRDIGFLPETTLYALAQKGAPAAQVDYARLVNVIEAAELATSRVPADFRKLSTRFDDADPAVRYWAATGCSTMPLASGKYIPRLKKLLNDSDGAVRTAAAEALYRIGDKSSGLKGLAAALDDPNVFVRVQALNVLQYLGEDALPVKERIQKLIPASSNPGQEGMIYDVRAARSFMETVGQK